MSFTVETGSGSTTANSLVDTPFFISYCQDRGYTVQAAWATPRMQVNLVKATDFLGMRYGTRFSGTPQNPYQALSFPRTLCWERLSDGADGWNGWGIVQRNRVLVPAGTIPLKIQQAVCELALVVDTDDLAPIVVAEDQNTVSEDIGPIKVSYTRKVKLSHDIVTKAAMLCSPFLVTGGFQTTMVRG